MLKTIIIKLPIVKLFLFNKFIEPDIAVIHVIIGDPIKKLRYINFILLKSIFNKIFVMGIIAKKGI